MNQQASISNPPDVWRTKLPVIQTSFVGRKHELAEVTLLLESSQLVTITGTAGCGKTRLALQVANNISSRYLDGVIWVDLAPLPDSRLVVQTVAKLLRISEQPDRPITDVLLATLREKNVLLILDNCEHVLDGCRLLLGALLPASEVSVLMTSREPLSLTGEKLYSLPPMALPPPKSAQSMFAQFDAIRLFDERAQTVVPDFVLTDENVKTVAEICRTLDGVPLAIELASARINVLAVEQIATRLADRFRLLFNAPQLTHSHHHTLRAAIDWSYDLLTVTEKVMLNRLSVFAGHCSLSSIETICAGDGIKDSQVLELVSSLVNKSLVVAQTLQRSEARYYLLHTIQQYSREKLIADGEWSTLNDRHLQYYLALTEETEPKLRGPYQLIWLDWLEGEFDNIRGALAWSLESKSIESGLRIANALYQFWTVRDYVEEGFAWVERLLSEVDASIPLVVHANALSCVINLAGFRGKTETIRKYGRDAAALVKAAEDADKTALSWALSGQYYAARVTGDHQTEFAHAKRLIELHRESGDVYLLSVALSTGSFSAMSLGKYAEARAMLNEAIPLLREMGNPYRVAMVLNFSGDLARCEQNYAQAQTAYEESISLLRELDAVRDLASVLHNLGHTCLHLGDVERARDLFGESTTLHEKQGNVPGIAECLIGYAAVAIVGDLFAAGARLLAAAVAIGGERVATTWAATKMEYEHYMALVRASLTEVEFEAAQTAGHTLSQEQAVEYAQNTALQAIALTKASKPQDELTLREREVAALIAQAKSNDEIAEELVLSKRTVEKHIANIRSKLGFSKRAEIVRWMIENGLIN